MTERGTLTMRTPMHLRRHHGGRPTPATPKPSRDEIKALVRAPVESEVREGQAKLITDLAEQEGVTVAYVCRLLPLTCLAPDIVEAILNGRQPTCPSIRVERASHRGRYLPPHGWLLWAWAGSAEPVLIIHPTDALHRKLPATFGLRRCLQLRIDLLRLPFRWSLGTNHVSLRATVSAELPSQAERLAMAKPLVITVSHQLSRPEAKRRLHDNMDSIQAQLAPYTSAVDSHWTDDRMDFRVAAFSQTVTGSIEVLDDAVRVEVQLPWMLAWLGTAIGDRVRQQGQLMLDKK